MTELLLAYSPITMLAVLVRSLFTPRCLRFLSIKARLEGAEK